MKPLFASWYLPHVFNPHLLYCATVSGEPGNSLQFLPEKHRSIPMSCGCLRLSKKGTKSANLTWSLLAHCYTSSTLRAHMLTSPFEIFSKQKFRFKGMSASPGLLLATCSHDSPIPALLSTCARQYKEEEEETAMAWATLGTHHGVLAPWVSLLHHHLSCWVLLKGDIGEAYFLFH